MTLIEQHAIPDRLPSTEQMELPGVELSRPVWYMLTALDDYNRVLPFQVNDEADGETRALILRTYRIDGSGAHPSVKAAIGPIDDPHNKVAIHAMLHPSDTSMFGKPMAQFSKELGVGPIKPEGEIVGEDRNMVVRWLEGAARAFEAEEAARLRAEEAAHPQKREGLLGRFASLFLGRPY